MYADYRKFINYINRLKIDAGAKNELKKTTGRQA